MRILRHIFCMVSGPPMQAPCRGRNRAVCNNRTGRTQGCRNRTRHTSCMAFPSGSRPAPCNVWASPSGALPVPCRFPANPCHATFGPALPSMQVPCRGDGAVAKAGICRLRARHDSCYVPQAACQHLLAIIAPIPSLSASCVTFAHPILARILHAKRPSATSNSRANAAFRRLASPPCNVCAKLLPWLGRAAMQRLCQPCPCRSRASGHGTPPAWYPRGGAWRASCMMAR